MYAISNQGVDVSVCDAEVRAPVVGTGEALSVYPFGSTPSAFDLAPGAHRKRRRFHTRREGGGDTAGWTIKWVRGLSRRWILVWMVPTLEWGGV